MQVIFLDWRYLQFYFLPTDKNFKASFFNWYVFPFQLVKSANTEFQLIKINRNLALIRLGFLKVVFPIWPPLIPRHHLYLCNREMPKKKKKILWKDESQWKEGENLHIFWRTLGMKFSEKMWLMIILSHKKKTVFGPFPRKDIFGKTIGEGQMDSTAFLGLDRSSKCALS